MSEFPGQCVCVSFSSFYFPPFLSARAPLPDALYFFFRRRIVSADRETRAETLPDFCATIFFQPPVLIGHPPTHGLWKEKPRFKGRKISRREKEAIISYIVYGTSAGSDSFERERIFSNNSDWNEEVYWCWVSKFEDTFFFFSKKDKSRFVFFFLPFFFNVRHIFAVFLN